MSKSRGIYYGWWIALSYFVMNAYWGGTVLSGLSVLFNPIRETFGFSATAITIAISFRQGLAVIGSPMVGYLFDRVGPKPLIFAATAFVAGGMLLLAAAHSTWQFYLSFLISGVGLMVFMSGTGPAAMATWFVRHRGKAISFIMSGTGVGAFLVPGVAWLVDTWDWRTAVVIIVVALLVVSVPATMLLRHRPEEYGLHPDGDPEPPARRVPGAVGPRDHDDFPFHEAMRAPAFWLSSVSLGLTAFGASAVMLFTIPHLEDEGFSSTAGALTLSAVGVIGMLSVLLFGWLADSWDHRRLLVLTYVCAAAGILVLALTSAPWHLGLFAALFGIGSRASFPILSSMHASYFGRTNFGKIQGILLSVFMVGGVLGPVLGALLRDASGSYQSSLFIYAGFTIAGIGVMALVKRPRRRGVAAAAGATAAPR